MNLLELPMLFYVGGLMYYVAGRVDGVGAGRRLDLCRRCAPSTRSIHVTYNNVIHRLTVFALSNVVLGAFWVLFFVR